MKTVLFATTNARKITEANAILTPLSISVQPIVLDIEEIQHANPQEIVKAKVRAAFEVAHEPVVVSDTSWAIPALGGFPGGYMKDISSWLQAEDWLSLMARHTNKTIECHEHLAYFDGEHLEHFAHIYTGHFVDTPRGASGDDISIEQVVSLYNNKTMAEQIAAGETASAGEDLQHWKKFGEWYGSRGA